MDKLFVTISGFGLIAFIWWFFFGKKEDTTASETETGVVEVLVDGGYKPSQIKLKKDQETTLNIKRTDSNNCLEEIVLPDFKIKKYLPVGEVVSVKITPHKSGEFGFHCGMNMYHGKIIVD